jgi:hypothetical protein
MTPLWIIESAKIPFSKGTRTSDLFAGAWQQLNKMKEKGNILIQFKCYLELAVDYI